MERDFPFVGRDSLVRDVRADHSPVLLIHGDSGVGKSDVATGVTSSASADSLETRPETVAWRSGALQQALLTSLGRALAEHLDAQNGLERFGEIVRTAARRVADARLQGLMGAVASFVQAAARKALGDGVVELGMDFMDAARTTEGEALAARITQAADADTMLSFAAFTAAVSDVVAKPVVITLDAIEKLTDDDFRFLRDLVGSMPAGLRLRLVLAVTDSESSRRLRQLEGDGAKPWPVDPLGEEVVRDWLAVEAIASEHVDDIVRTSQGYPLFIIAGIEHLRSGQHLSDLQGQPGFTSRIRDNFASLQEIDHRVVAAAAAFVDPPDEEAFQALTGLSGRELAHVIGRLVERRLFSTTVNGRPWFHELGRRAVWHVALIEDERQEVATSAAAQVLTRASDSGYFLRDALDLVRWLPDAPTLLRAHEGAAETLGVSRAELAVLGAVLELHEPHGEQAGLNAEHVILHAAELTGQDDSLIEPLRSLASQDLVFLLEEESGAAVVALWKSALMRLVVVGRAAAELSRPVKPAVASSVIDQVIRPLASAFRYASIAVGVLSMANMSQWAIDMIRHPPPGTDSDSEPHIAEAGLTSVGLLLRMRWGSVDMSCVLIFAGALERDEARHTLAALHVPDFSGQQLKVSAAMAWPVREPLAEKRFVSAYESVSENEAEIEPTSLRERLLLEVRAWELIRKQATGLEQDVLGLHEARGFIFQTDGESSLICDVLGLGDVIELSSDVSLQGPFAWSGLQRAAGLPAGSRITKITIASGRPSVVDPVGQVLAEAAAEVRQFMKAQLGVRLLLDLNASELEVAILAAANARSGLALGLVSDGLAKGEVRNELFTSYKVLLQPLVEETDSLRLWDGMATWQSTPAPVNSVSVVIGHPLSADADLWRASEFEEHFGARDDLGRFSLSDLPHGLGELLDVDSKFIRIGPIRN